MSDLSDPSALSDMSDLSDLSDSSDSSDKLPIATSRPTKFKIQNSKFHITKKAPKLMLRRLH